MYSLRSVWVLVLRYIVSSWDLCKIALLKVYAMYGAWLALRNFFLDGACLFSISMKAVSNDSYIEIASLNFSFRLFSNLVSDQIYWSDRLINIFVTPIVFFYRGMVLKWYFHNCDYHFLKIRKPIRKRYCILKTQKTVCYKKINTARILCTFKTSVFLDEILCIAFIKDRHGSDSSALNLPKSINLS